MSTTEPAGAQAAKAFDYDRAFSRNLGVVSEAEQQKLSQSCVAVVGTGGIGGYVAQTLARLGIGRMKLSDPDTFDLANFNRQGGASMSTLGKPKASTVGAQVKDINAAAEVFAMDQGVDASNVASFLEGVDLVVDAVDFFCLDVRKLIYAEARRRRIPIVISAPLGMSCTLHVFTPDGMSFEDYFDLRPGQSRVDQLVAFLVGLAPRMAHRSYIDMRYTNVKGQYGPSLCPAVMLACGFLGVEVVRLLLGRPGVKPAPCYLQVDAYRGRWLSGRLWLGSRNPVQRLKRALAKRTLLQLVDGVPPEFLLPAD